MANATALKAQFKKLDKNGDGCLSLQELSDLLKKGNPNIKAREIKMLYDKCDTNGDGVIQFDEFVDYINSSAPQAAPSGRTTAGRHAAAAAASTSNDEGDEGMWESVQSCFESFAGKDLCLQGVEFAKFCKQNKLYNKGFTKNDVDLVFAKVVPKGQRAMHFDEFRSAVMQIALKRKCPTRDVQAIIIETGGVTFEGTKADAVRFHDDKSSYTGAHTQNAHHGVDQAGVEARRGDARHEKLAAESSQAAEAQADEGDWDEVQLFFNDFAKNGRCSVVDFTKLLMDTGCIKRNGKFSKTDAELIFSSKAPRGEKFVGFDNFKEMLRSVAVKMGLSVGQLQAKITSSDGQILVGTEGASRFHDDKDTYTGMHYGK